MIGTIRKHSTWLWFMIIVAVIVTFVFWGSSSSRYDNGRMGKQNLGTIDSQRITKEEYGEAGREVYLRYFLNSGTWPDRDTRKTGFDETREIYRWLFLVKKLKDYNIEIDNRSVAQAVDDILRNFGRGNPVPFDAFVQRVLVPHASGYDFERFIRHNLGIQQLVSVAALSGKLVTPDDAQFLYERDHRESLVDAVFFSGTNYLARVAPPTPDALARFYTNEMSSYHVPERVQVQYVAFGISNSLDQVEKQITNLTALVEEKLRQIGTNYHRFGKTPEEVKGLIRREFIRGQALQEAQKKAEAFANELFTMEPVQASNLAALAKTNGLAVKVTAPFDAEHGPIEFDGGASFAKAAFSLSEDKPFPDQPIVGEDTVYMIALDRRIPDEILFLDQIRDRVAADYRAREAVLLARQAMTNFVHTATNALAQGKTFAAICQQANVKGVSIPAFSLSTQELPEVEEHLELTQFKQLTFTTPVGKLSSACLTPEGGVTLFLRQHVPADASRMKAEMPAFLNLIRRAREQEAFNLWLAKEESVSLRNTPLAQRKQAATPGGGQQPTEP